MDCLWIRRACAVMLCTCSLFFYKSYLRSLTPHQHCTQDTPFTTGSDTISPRQDRIRYTEPEMTSSDDLVRFQSGWTDLTDEHFLSYIRTHWLTGPSHRPYNVSSEPQKDTSQVGQSAFIDKTLNHMRDGFFVECGAADGETYSNTLFFERSRGWTGLLIEANSVFYNKLISKNRKAYSLNACLSVRNATEQVDFIQAEMVGGIATAMGDSHLRWVRAQNQQSRVMTSQCFPFYSVLLALGVDHIHYFSLDVEGPELLILQTVPLHAVKVEVFSIEYLVMDSSGVDRAASAQKLENIRRFFRGTGLYEEVATISVVPGGRDGLDVIFKRKQ